MNSKEIIIQILNSYQVESDYPKLYQEIISDVENAIFDIPTEEKVIEELTEEKASKDNKIDLNAYAIGVSEAFNYILNYKKQTS